MRKITPIAFAFICVLLFSACALADFTLPSGLKTIEAQAFSWDTSLKGTLVIPEGVTSIGDEAFRGCTGLTGLVIPSSLRSIGARAFYGCKDLSGVLYLDGVSYAASSFAGTKLVLGVRVAGVSLQDTGTVFSDGGTLRLSAEVLPENATIKDLVWESTDPDVAYVDGNGLVTGVAPGQATIKATAADGSGAAASCRVTVLPRLEIVSLTGDITARPGSSVTLEAVPSGGTGSYTFQWYFCRDESSAGVRTYTGRRISMIVGENDGTFWYYCVVTSGTQSVASRRIRITVASDSISIAPASFSAAQGGESWRVDVTAGGAWTASSDSAWLTPERTWGSGSAAVVISAASNASGAPRQGRVTFTCGNAVSVHTVWQPGADLKVDPTDFGLLNPESFYLTSQVAAGGSWTAKSDSSWVTVTPSAGSGNGYVSFFASQNNGSTARMATITFTSGDLRTAVTLTQDAWSLNVTPETPEKLPSSGGTVQFDVYAKYGTWSAQTDAAWLTLSSSSGEGEGTRITAAAAANTSSARSAVVTFSVGNVNKQITVTQEGSGQGSYTPPSVTALSVSLQGDKYIGTPYSVYDCQAFVEKCLSDAGMNKDLAGSNAWYREMTWRGTPEECVAKFGYIPKGAFLFIVVHDGGEPSIYQDGLGNANHIGIYTGRNKGAIHSSYSRQGVFESYFECATIPNGGWNMVGLWRELDYGDSAINAFLAGR